MNMIGSHRLSVIGTVTISTEHCMKRLCFTKEGDKLVGKVLDQEDTYWIFSDITEDSFKWENVMIRKDGTRIQDCEIHGKRIG